jgi:chromosome segregation ATPase
MDDAANDLGPDPDRMSTTAPEREGVPARSASADRLVSRLVELRAQLEVLAPQDQERGREAIERIRQAHERIATLEEMLAQAREREDVLTTQAVRDRSRITELASQISELSSIAARVSGAEEAHREADVNAADSERARKLAEAEVQTQRAETERLSTRCSELESDLKKVAEELAAAALARAEAVRLETERNEARERAHTERRLAAEDRLRAATASLRATELQSQLRAAERRIVQLTNERGASATKPQAFQEVFESTRTEAPWTALQRATSAAARPPTSAASPASVPPPASNAERPEPAGDGDVIDLTVEEPSPAEHGTAIGTAEREDVPAASGAPHPKGVGLLGRVLRGRHHEPGTGRT